MSVSLSACGSGGSGSGGDGADDGVNSPGTPGVVKPVIEVKGRIFLGDVVHPAVDHAIWLLDHTQLGVTQYPINAAGAFAIPLEVFRVDHVYSLHLVKDDRVLADVDFDPDLPEAQTALTYEGGWGFDLGDVVANLTRRGDLDRANPGVVSRVGGGFLLDENRVATLDTLPLPSGVTTFSVKSQLLVFDPLSLHYAYFRHGEFPERHAEALAQDSRVATVVVAAEKGTVSRVDVVDGGSWLKASRLAAGDEAARGSSALWSSSAFALTSADGQLFRASTFTGSLLDSRSFAMVRIQPATGTSFELPRPVGSIFTVPPQPTAISLTGGAATAIDYASDTAADGLLRPFCLTAAGPSITLAPPRDELDQPVVSAAQRLVEVSFDYYGLDANQRTVKLTPALADFPATYQAAFTGTATDPQPAWDPALARLSFLWTEAAAAARATTTLALPAEPFLISAGGGGVMRIRLRISFKSATDSAEAASAVWFDADGDCP